MSESSLALPKVADDDAVEIDSRQFVTFFVGGEMFAVPMAPVQEIIRPPEVVRVPLAPDCLDGLSNLRGRVLPIIGLRHIFGHEPIEQDDATRALVIDLGIPLGFVVDRVSSVISVEPESIEPVTSIHGSVQSEFLSGVIKLADAQHKAGGMVMIVDFAALIDQEFAAIAAACVSSRAMMTSAAAAGSVDDEEVESDELQLVSFEVAEQEYAIAIEQVQEIVQVPPTFVKVPNVASHVLGLMSLRQRLLPLVSLRRMFALPELDATENHRIVVIALPGGQSVGVVMDAVNEVLRVPRTEVENVPALFSRGGDLDEISGICRLDDGRRLVSIISAERMFSHPAVRDAIAAADAQSQGEGAMGEDRTAASDDDVNDDELQVVVFRLGNEEFGVPIDSVQEIVRVPDELTRVPKAPDFVEGVINLRGTVLPVIDQRRRFGLKCTERNDRQRIMVYVLAGMRTGFIVDVVAEVLKIPKAAVSPAPALSEEQARLVKSVANLEKAKRLVMLIEPEQLLEGEEIRDLEQVA
jgi:purine-binding chemotaxis protein CheW